MCCLSFLDLLNNLSHCGAFLPRMVEETQSEGQQTYKKTQEHFSMIWEVTDTCSVFGDQFLCGGQQEPFRHCTTTLKVRLQYFSECSQ